MDRYPSVSPVNSADVRAAAKATPTGAVRR